MTPNITDMTSRQLLDWLASVVNGDIFTSRERLIALLAKGAPHTELEEEFREFFEGYCGLAFELEPYEESVLGDYEQGKRGIMYTLKHRVLAVGGTAKYLASRT